MNLLIKRPYKYIICSALALATTISPLVISEASALAITNMQLEFGAKVVDIANVTTGNIVADDFVITAGANDVLDIVTSGDATVDITRNESGLGVLGIGDEATTYHEIDARAQGHVFEPASASFFADGATDMSIEFINNSATDTYSVTLEIAYFIQSVSSVTLPGLEEASSSTYFDFVEDVGLPIIDEFVQSSAVGTTSDFVSNAFTVDLQFDPFNNVGSILFRPLSTTGLVQSQVPAPSIASLLALGFAGFRFQKWSVGKPINSI